MHKFWIIMATLIALTLPATAKPRPSSAQALREAGLTALKQGDAEAYIRLLFTLADIKKYCPQRSKMVKPAHLKRLHAKTREAVKHCHGLFDWSKAKLLRVEGGERRKVDEVCKQIVELKDIKVYYSVGSKTYRVKLDDPLIFGAKIYAVGDDPRCRAVTR